MARLTLAVEVAAVFVFAVAWAVDASPMVVGSAWALPTLALAVIAAAWIGAAQHAGWNGALALVTAVALSWLNYSRLEAGRSGGPSLVLMLLVEVWICLRGTHRDSLVAVGAALATSASYLFDGDLASVTGMVVVVLLSAVGARAYRAQQAALAELRVAQARVVSAAAEQERARIARDIHDVAAHSLAVTMLHLTGARLLAERSGGDSGVVEALVEAESAGREAMMEIRQVMGLLPGAPPPQPGSASASGDPDVLSLVDIYRTAGCTVELDVEGDVACLPPLIGLTVYRVVREGLANAARHAPGARVAVRLTVGRTTRVTVTDDGGTGPVLSAGGGFGLAAMRARVEALGGTVEAGPESPGWRLEATLPAAGIILAEPPSVAPV